MTKTRAGLLALLAGITFTQCSPPAAEFPPGTEPRHVRVVWAEVPQHRATVLWDTTDAGAKHELILSRLGETSSETGGATSFAATTGPYTRHNSEEPLVHWHRVQLTDLEPSTRYRLRVRSDSKESKDYWFLTAPDDRRPFAVISGSDSRSYRNTRRRMNERIARLAIDETVLAFAHGGDYVKHGHLISWMAEWLDDHELTVTDSGRLLPIVPARGNHESTTPVFDEVFGAPGTAMENWYVTRFSPLATLVTLNTEAPATGRQLDFLHGALREAQSCTWQFVQYHQALWPAVKRAARPKRHWVPAFEEHNVDLAIESDGHVMKRTVPIRGDRQDPSGVIYIGEGGIGASQRTPDRSRWFLQEPGMADSQDHVWRIEFSPESIRLTALDDDGDTVDEVTIRR